jgi:hypothetical protein
VHCLGESCGYAQAGEAAGSAGYINMLDLAGLSAETLQQGADGGENLGTVLQRTGKYGLCEHSRAERQCNRACSAGCFDSQDKGVFHHIPFSNGYDLCSYLEILTITTKKAFSRGLFFPPVCPDFSVWRIIIEILLAKSA